MASSAVWAQPLTTTSATSVAVEKALPDQGTDAASSGARSRAMEQELQRLAQTAAQPPAHQPPAIPSPWPDPSHPQAPTGEQPVPGVAPSGSSATSGAASKDVLQVTGGYRLSAGFTNQDVILRDANGDYNERNFRIISPAFLQENTYDPAIYSRLWFDADTTNEQGWNLHAKVVVDPWSFTGTTSKFTVESENHADIATIQLKYWGNTGRTINETFWTDRLGDTFAVPEIETDDGHTVRTRVGTTFGGAYVIPERDIDFSFQPLRELWLDYATDTTQFRVFPIAYENQALSSDDPLGLSNHHTYWQWSPWIEQWVPGRYLPSPDTNAFVQGQWNHDLAFFTRDSDLQHLTALRGATLLWQPSDLASVQAGIASPKTLWQPYESWDSFVAMARPKYQLMDQLTLGGIYTTRWAYKEGLLDTYDHVFGLDAEYKPMDWLTLETEGAHSFSAYDRSLIAQYDVQGWMWHVGLKADKTLGGAISEEAKEAGETEEHQDRIGGRLYYTHMDDGFDPGLANYHETRADTFWGRHLSFYRPLRGYEYTHAGTMKAVTVAKDIEPFRIGDGVDVGRDVMGLRLTSQFLDGRWESLYDYRNVHDANGKFIEDIIRTEQTWHATARLTSKFLFIYHHLPHTTGGVDPLLFDTTTLIKDANAQIPDDQDPSTLTFASGLEYFLLDNLSAYSIWEVTQDEGLDASDSYPRGLFNSASLPIALSGDQRLRYKLPFLYDQGVFPRAPYPWSHIFKVGAHWEATDRLECNFSWTRNTYEFAGQIDQNMNHISFEMGYHPWDRVVLLGKYTWSTSFDLPRLNDTGGTDIEYTHHNNMYFEAHYRVSDASELTCEFGVGTFYNTAQVFSVDPTGEYFPALDTQMIVRIAYTGKF